MNTDFQREFTLRQMDRVPVCLADGQILVVDPSCVTRVLLTEGDDNDALTIGETTYQTPDKQALKELIMRSGLKFSAAYYRYDKAEVA